MGRIDVVLPGRLFRSASPFDVGIVERFSFSVLAAGNSGEVPVAATAACPPLLVNCLTLFVLGSVPSILSSLRALFLRLSVASGGFIKKQRVRRNVLTTTELSPPQGPLSHALFILVMPTEELIAHSLGALKSLIDAMKLLSGADKKPTSQKDLSSVLKSRLLALNDLHITELTYAEHELDVLDVDGVQYRTANAALWILERLYTQLQASGADELSLNEQNSLRRLAALVYRWKISKELEGCNAVEESARSSAQERLLESTSRVLRLIFPEEEERGGNNAVQIMFKQSFPDLLPALFTLGWAPLGEKAESIRALTYRLLSR